LATNVKAPSASIRPLCTKNLIEYLSDFLAEIGRALR
jgi:hypothetical protein